MPHRTVASIVSWLAVGTGLASAQSVARIDVTPASVTLDIGGTVQLKAVAVDSAGGRLTVPIAYFSTARRAVEVDSTGLVKALLAGDYKIVAVGVGAARNSTVRGEVAVSVRAAPIQSVVIEGGPARYYTETTTRHRATCATARTSSGVTSRCGGAPTLRASSRSTPSVT